jgi:hypothetical protein
MFFASCGGGSGSSSGKKLASNEVFGDLPNAVYQRQYANTVAEKHKNVERDKLDGNNKGDQAKWKKIQEKYKKSLDENEAKLAAEVEKIKPTLIGKEIPYEVEEGAPYEITSCKIVEVGQHGYVDYELVLKITDAKAIKTNWNDEYYVNSDYVDKAGNRFSGGSNGVKISKKENGATCTHKGRILFDNAERYVDFAKIKFLKGE